MNTALNVGRLFSYTVWGESLLSSLLIGGIGEKPGCN